MTKQEMVEKIQQILPEGSTKRATEQLIDRVLDEVVQALKKDGTVRIPDFGVFKVRARKARIGRNPATGDAVKIPASRTIGFKPAKQLKDQL